MPPIYIFVPGFSVVKLLSRNVAFFSSTILVVIFCLFLHFTVNVFFFFKCENLSPTHIQLDIVALLAVDKTIYS